MNKSGKCQCCEVTYKYPSFYEDLTENEKKYCYSCRMLSDQIELVACVIEQAEFHGKKSKDAFAKKLRSIKLF